MTLRMALNVKLMGRLFLELPFDVCGPRLTLGNKPGKVKMHKEDYCTLYSSLSSCLKYMLGCLS